MTVAGMWSPSSQARTQQERRADDSAFRGQEDRRQLHPDLPVRAKRCARAGGDQGEAFAVIAGTHRDPFAPRLLPETNQGPSAQTIFDYLLRAHFKTL